MSVPLPGSSQDAGLPGSWRELLNGGNLGRLALICFGVWLHAADSLLATTMLPAIVEEIGGARFVAWTIALYIVGSIAAGASGAVLSARHGLKASMSASALIYMAGCAVSAMAPEMWVMLVGRLVQGVGGGGLVALSFIAVTRHFSRAAMPRVLAAVSFLWGVSAFIGPLVGGLFADLGFWRGGFWAFAAQALILGAVIAVTSSLPPGNENGSAGRLPLWRLGMLSLGVVAIAAAGIEVTAVQTPALVLVGLVLLGAFLRLDARRVASRLLPTRPVDPRNPVGAGLLMILCFASATVAFTVYGPLLITRIHGVPALVAGYLVAASSIGWSVAAVIISGTRERYDNLLIFAGMLMLTISIAGFAVAIPYGPLWTVLVCAVLEGVGFGVSWTFILRRLTHFASSDDTERAASAMPTTQQVGYAVGAAYAGIVGNAAGIADEFGKATAQRVGFWVFTACLPLAFIGLYAAWCFVRRRHASHADVGGRNIMGAEDV